MNATLCATLALALAVGAVDDDPQDEADSNWEYLAKKYDANSDGKISRKEYDRDDEHWQRLDADGDGFVTRSEVEADDGRRGRGRPNRERVDPPKVGVKAPNFDLERLPPPPKKGAKPKKQKVEKVKLSSFKGKKPVALIFGSYT